jgi:hypothetical protein
MKLLINLTLVGLVILVAAILISSIQEPIAFNEQLDRRERAVISKLQQIRKAQEFHRAVAGHFANDFDELTYNLTNGMYQVITAYGDPDDPTKEEIKYDTIRKPAIDSIRVMKINLDSLRYVPFGEGSVFDMKADTIPYEKSEVNVLEVGVSRSKFMGRFADKKYQKYDDKYEPESRIKFGNLTKPNLTGNWER